MTHRSKNVFKRLALSSTALCMSAGISTADIVQADDVIITGGSLCVGFDCVNSENFSFDTIRMKENNVRLHFEDTSATSSFPGNDWRLIANDSSNGGLNKFSLEDSTAGRVPFTVEAGAAANALYVSDAGDVGIGTGTPLVELHAVDGNTPALRLEQNGTSGFTPQSYDIAANETNFFVRDVTNGSKLVFKILRGAPDNGLVVHGDGKLGLGTTNATAGIDLRSVGSKGADVHLLDNIGSGPLQMLKMQNNGAVQLMMDNTTNTNAQWMFSAGQSMLLVPSDNPTDQVFELASTGNMTIKGTLTQMSDRNAKTGIEAVDPSEILAKVRAMPVSAWTYKHDAEDGIRHIGPMAQDFYAAFGTGRDDKGISSLDGSGVALAAIQALSDENADLRARLLRLETQISAD